MTADSIPVVVKKVVKETDNAKSIFIERKDGRPISYQPGQFLHFGFKQMHETAYRSYSLSTVPEEGVAFTVKEMENGNIDRKSTRLNSSHVKSSYAVFCLKK